MSKTINFITGFSIVFGIWYLCNFLLNHFNIPFPSPILGLIVFFVLLKTNIIKEKWIKLFCDISLKFMILFFVPLFVGLVSYIDLIKNNFVAIFFTVITTTVIVLVLVGLFVEYAIKFSRLNKIKKYKGELK